MSLINELTDKLREINGGNVSGGGTPWKDMMFYQDINPEESVIWHYSSWIPSELADDEELQFMTIVRWRKKPLTTHTMNKVNPKKEKKH